MHRKQDKLTADTTQTKPTLGELVAAKEALQAEAAQLVTDIQTAARNNDILGMLAANSKLSSNYDPEDIAAAAVDGTLEGKPLKVTGPIYKAIRAAERMGFEERNVERDAAVADIQNEGCMYPADSITRFLGLRITGYTVSFTEDGRAEVKVAIKGAAGQSGISGTPRTRARKVYMLNGGQYTSRELLEQFGDVVEAPKFLFEINGQQPLLTANFPEITGLGSWALWRTTEKNWKAAGAAYNPGYDNSVNKIAEKVGAVRADAS